MKNELTRLRFEATHKLTLKAAEAVLLHKCKRPSIFTTERQSLKASTSQKKQAKPGVSDSPLLCGDTTESVIGGDVKQHELVSDKLPKGQRSTSSQESTSNTHDSQAIDSQNKDT